MIRLKTASKCILAAFAISIGIVPLSLLAGRFLLWALP